MDWSVFDFLVAALLLVLLFGAIGLIFVRRWSWLYRLGLALSLITGALLFWVAGAVGLIGGAAHDANMAYPAMLTLGLIGSVVVRFKASGLALLLGGLGIAQLAIGLIAVLAGWGQHSPRWPDDILAASFIFSLLWLSAGFCFWRDWKTR